MVLLLKNIFFSFLIFSNVLGYGYILKKFFKEQETRFTIIFIYGTVLMIAVSLLINFFFPLNAYLTNSLFIIFVILGINEIYKNIFLLNNLKIIIFLTLFSSIIIYKSYPYNDYEIYHLPFIETIRNYKIIFGLSNFNFRFGHTSILQYLSALQYNSFMKLDSFIYYPAILVSLILGEVIFNFKNNNYLIVKFISFVFVLNYFFHANRFGSLGNDFPSHALSFLTYIYFFELIKKQKDNNIFRSFIFLILITTLSKLSLIVNILLIIPLLLLKRNVFNFNIKTLFIILIVISAYSVKNFINTSCIFYPLNFTCIETKWMPKLYDFSHPKFVSLYSKAGNRDFPILSSENKVIPFDPNTIIQKKINNNINLYNNLSSYEKKIFEKYAVYNEYNKFKNWSKRHYENHFKRKFLNQVFLFLSINLVLFFLFNRNFKFKINRIEKFTMDQFYFIVFLILSTIVWFFASPLLRYGISYIYILANLPLFIFMIFYSNSKNIVSKYFNILIFVGFIFTISDNIFRINSFKSTDNYTDNIVPLKKALYTKVEINKININLTKKPNDHYCSYIPPLCLSSEMNDFMNSDFKLSRKKNYLFITK